MSQRIDQFCEDLRLNLTKIDSSLSGLKAKIEGKAQNAEQEARSHLEKVQKRIEQNRTKLSSAQSELKNWVEEQKTATRDKVAEWRTKRETSKLQTRADKGERYAAAAIVVAMAAADEAEQQRLMRGLRDKMRILPRPKLREANKRVDGSAPGLTSVGALRFARPQAGKILSRIGNPMERKRTPTKKKKKQV
jgi:chromosome segregation ATPase